MCCGWPMSEKVTVVEVTWARYDLAASSGKSTTDCRE
jgi:hypothetical protein